MLLTDQMFTFKMVQHNYQQTLSMKKNHITLYCVQQINHHDVNQPLTVHRWIGVNRSKSLQGEYTCIMCQQIYTVAQTRHFIKHLLHDFTKHLLHSFTICPTLLQFAPLFYNLPHSFTICSTLLQFAPLFYNLLHSFTICSTLLQFPPLFYNFFHDFTISSTMLQFAL